MDQVVKSIEEARDGRDIFVVGCSNTGKSTFVNQLMQVWIYSLKIYWYNNYSTIKILLILLKLVWDLQYHHYQALH